MEHFVAGPYITQHLGSMSLTPIVSIVAGSVFSSRCDSRSSFALSYDRLSVAYKSCSWPG